MNDNRPSRPAHPRPPWRSLEQLAETWGLSRARTNLVVKALLRSGRLEERRTSQDHPRGCAYRVVDR